MNVELAQLLHIILVRNLMKKTRSMAFILVCGTLFPPLNQQGTNIAYVSFHYTRSCKLAE